MYDIEHVDELLRNLSIPKLTDGKFWMLMSWKAYRTLKREARRIARQEQKRLSHKQGKRRF